MSRKPWWWVWVQGGPMTYTPADSPEDAARSFTAEYKVPWDSRVHVALDTVVFEFGMKAATPDG